MEGYQRSYSSLNWPPMLIKQNYLTRIVIITIIMIIQTRCPSCHQTNSVKALKARTRYNTVENPHWIIGMDQQRRLNFTKTDTMKYYRRNHMSSYAILNCENNLKKQVLTQVLRQKSNLLEIFQTIETCQVFVADGSIGPQSARMTCFRIVCGSNRSKTATITLTVNSPKCRPSFILFSISPCDSGVCCCCCCCCCWSPSSSTMTSTQEYKCAIKPSIKIQHVPHFKLIGTLLRDSGLTVVTVANGSRFFGVRLKKTIYVVRYVLC